jgi:glycosyltransferase involved in cell wall biosynthesis
MPTVSCIVPVYNGAAYLSEALESILAQTLPVTELIVVDDGSTDATPAIAARYSPPVRYIRQDNLGPAAARNTGLELAGGDFISFLDADDTWHPEKLARQMSVLEAELQVGICLTHVQNFWTDEFAHDRDRIKDNPLTKPLIGYVCQALLARRDVFEKVGYFDQTLRIGEDSDWFTRVQEAKIGKVVLPQVLVYRRIHGKNTSLDIYHSPAARAALLEKVILRHHKRRRAGASKE